MSGRIENEEDLEVLSDIEETITKNINLGFDLKVLDILDNSEASLREIEALKVMLSQDIVIRLIGLGDSAIMEDWEQGRFSSFPRLFFAWGCNRARFTFLLFLYTF